MAFISLTTAETTSGKAIVQSLMRKIKDNFDWLSGTVGTLYASDIPNGSFEVDSDGDGIPDSWVAALYPGGTVAIDTAVPVHGANCMKMVHPGGVSNGGGTLTSDYVPCSEYAAVLREVFHWVTAAGMKDQVVFYWYTAAKVACATASTTVYDSVANPTVPTLAIFNVTPPATARFFKVKIAGGMSTVNVAGSSYWDGFKRPEITSRNPTTAGVSGANTSSSYVDLCSVALPTTWGIYGPARITARVLLSVIGPSLAATANFRLRVLGVFGEVIDLLSESAGTSKDAVLLGIDVTTLPPGSVVALQGQLVGGTSFSGAIKANGLSITLQVQ